jgi:predicted nucleotidyltransferase
MLESLITSKTRIKLLLKFFLNANTTSYLRGLEPEFDESTNAIRQELNRFEKAGLLVAESQGNKKIYHANTSHPLFPDLNSLLMKHVGLDKIIEKVIAKLGNLEKVYLLGDLAKGLNSTIIDLLFVGDVDQDYLKELVDKVEILLERKVAYVVMAARGAQDFLHTKPDNDVLLLWEKE